MTSVTTPACPDAGACTHGCSTKCFRVETCEPLSDVFDGDQWPAWAVADPTPLAIVDGVVVPPGFVEHNGLTWVAALEDVTPPQTFAIRATAAVGGWYRCSCGWSSGPLNPNDLSQRLPIPRGEAWVAWARHLPPGFLAFRDALVLFRDDTRNPAASPPTGWDSWARYSWRNWTVTVADDGKITVERDTDVGRQA
jgi:hypothetical protein